MKVFVVLCKYEGCDECSGGAHIVGVFESKNDAEEASNNHQCHGYRDPRNEHLHFYSSDVYENEVQ